MPETQFINLRLILEQIEGNLYRAKLEHESQPSSKPVTFGFSLNDVIRDNDETFNHYFKEKIATLKAKENELEVVGKALYNLVFREDLGSKFEAWYQALNRGEAIRLHLDIQTPDLMNVPWELLCDERQFLARRNVSIVRYRDDSPKENVELNPKKLKVLIVSASPKKNSFDEESYIQPVKSLFERVVITPDILKGTSTTRANLLTKLDQNEYDLFHFIGHGALEKGKGKVYLVDEESNIDAVGGSDLSDWLWNSGVKFAFFCSCQTGMTDEENSFNGVADSMIGVGIPAVVAMQYNLSQEEAKPIVESFYEKLLRSESIDEAMKFARQNLSSGNVSWCVPALYSQFKVGRIVKAKPKPRTNGNNAFELTAQQMRELKEEIGLCYQNNEDGLKNLVSNYKDQLTLNYSEIPGNTPKYRIDYLIEQLYLREKLALFLDITGNIYPSLKYYYNLLNVYQEVSFLIGIFKIILRQNNKYCLKIIGDCIKINTLKKIDDFEEYLCEEIAKESIDLKDIYYDNFGEIGKLQSYKVLEEIVEKSYSETKR